MTTMGELVDNLFRTHRRRDGREHTYVEIAEYFNGAVDPSHLSRLRAGHIKNPGRDILLALCQFFKVPPSYFFPELESPLKTPEGSDAIHAVARRMRVSPSAQQKFEDLMRALSEEGEEKEVKEEEGEGEK